jgi:hypothetical protein
MQDPQNRSGGFWMEENAASLGAVAVLQSLLASSLNDVDVPPQVGFRVYYHLRLAEDALRQATRVFDAERYPGQWPPS